MGARWPAGPCRDRDAEAPRPAGQRAVGQAPASALMTDSAISCAQWLVASVTGAGGYGQTMLPCFARISTGRKVPSFFGMRGSRR